MPKKAPINLPLVPPLAMGAAYGLVTAPAVIGVVPVDVSPTFLQPLSPQSPQSVGNLSPLVNNALSESEEEDNLVSSEGEVDEENYSHSVGPNSYISKKMKQVEDLDECAEILKVVNARFKYLNLETCLCGKRLTKNYVESRICKSCTLEQKKTTILMCQNCHLITLKGKFKEIGFCKHCSDLIEREELRKMKLVKK